MIQPLLGNLPTRNENICPYGDLDMNVHNSFIWNSPKLETPNCSSTGEWMNKLLYSQSTEYYS